MPTEKFLARQHVWLTAAIAGLLSVVGSGPARAQGTESLWTVGETGLQVQNVDLTGQADIRARFFDFDGHLTHDILRSVHPGGATNFYLPQIELDEGLVPQSYALIVTSNRPVAAISRTEDRRTGAALLYDNIPPATHVAIPLVTKSYANQNSLVSIQNTSTSAPARLGAEIYRGGDATPIRRLDMTIPPAGSGLVDFWRDRDLADIPDGFVGWMRLTSDVPITAQASVHHANSAKAVAAFEGLPADAAAARLYVPLIRRAWYGTTGISVVNPSLVDATRVTARYYGTLGSCAGQTFTQGPIELGPAAGAVFFQGPGNVPFTGATPLPEGCAGSAVLEAAGGGILGMVMDLDSVDRPHTAAAVHASGSGAGALKLAAPLIRNRHTAADLVTGIQVMNVDAARPAVVHLQVIDIDGNVIPAGPDHVATIAPLRAWTWYLPVLSGVRDRRDLYGSAILSSDAPIAAVVVESSLNGRSDTAAYNAIPVRGQGTAASAGSHSLRLPLSARQPEAHP